MTDENKQMMNLDQPKPNNFDAEKRILYYILNSKRTRQETYDILNALQEVDKPFYSVGHQKIFENMLRSFDSSTESTPSLFDGLSDDEKEDFIMKKIDNEYDKDIINQDIQEVIELAKIRKVISTCTEIIQKCYNEGNVDDDIKMLSRILQNINRCRTCKFFHYKNINTGTCMFNPPKLKQNNDGSCSSVCPIVHKNYVCGSFEEKA